MFFRVISLFRVDLFLGDLLSAGVVPLAFVSLFSMGFFFLLWISYLFFLDLYFPQRGFIFALFDVLSKGCTCPNVFGGFCILFYVVFFLPFGIRIFIFILFFPYLGFLCLFDFTFGFPSIFCCFFWHFFFLLVVPLFFSCGISFYFERLFFMNV